MTKQSFKSIDERSKVFGTYMIENHATIRSTAKQYGFSKSTVHTDLRFRLPKVDYDLYLRVQTILIKNGLEKHLRGGESTRLKYSA